LLLKTQSSIQSCERVAATAAPPLVLLLSPLLLKVQLRSIARLAATSCTAELVQPEI
jgi:hypothetical protein